MRRFTILLGLVIFSSLVPAAGAAEPRTGTWYGGSPETGAVLFDVTRRQGETVIGRVRYEAFGRRCPGVETIGISGFSRPVVVGGRGRFVSTREDRAKMIVSGRVRERSISMTARPVFGRPAEIRCFTRTFTARYAGPPRLRSGAWRGVLAEQPPQGEGGRPLPAQPFRFSIEERGRVFVGGGASVSVMLHCGGTDGGTRQVDLDLFDLARPVAPDGAVEVRERYGSTQVSWTLRSISRTTMEGTLRIRSDDDGRVCETGEIGLSASL